MMTEFMNHRVPAHKRYQPTEYEHAANCATHALWIIPSILGSSNLYFLSDDDWETISAWIYGLGLCGLFVVSTMFHTISWKKSHLRMVEHCLHMFDRMVIYFFIAASYAPWLNLRELGPWASHMRWLVWIMASVGTIYVFFFHERYKLVELLCYVIMGFFPALVLLSMQSLFTVEDLEYLEKHKVNEKPCISCLLLQNNPKIQWLQTAKIIGISHGFRQSGIQSLGLSLRM
ncbi:monocyte to macrophage differentiation factor 2 isoform X3 [Leptonychotes weddellii]|uniref:Monocyte to macrophage differentiation factor 2 isoform X3 n=1 Tax=Leptonychotes weddellii TaxID=9713 RepID=A0A7F8QVK8_LEPWE|nr:monocyte to macrophage differentiation factor 2 isoform X3 [Leptonychotes weddellii]